MYSSQLFFLLISVFSYTSPENVRRLGDEGLLELVKTKNYLTVLFTKANCEPCTRLEQELNKIHTELESNLNTVAVTAENSHLVRLYSPSKEPALVYFRHGVPVLYSGDTNSDEIYSFIERNKEPAVKELTDNIFEHLTQAASGATTGDWLVMFYSASCVDCQRLQAVWEGVGATLKGRINVARVDTAGSGALTAKRFQITTLPTVILLRLGKMYRYDLAKHDLKSYVSFAQDWYKHAKAEPVRLMQSPFDELVTFAYESILYLVSLAEVAQERYPWLRQAALLGATGFGLVLLTALIALLKARAPATPKPTQHKQD